MSGKAKRSFLRCLMLVVLTLVIVTVHFIITPNHRPYAVPAYGIVLLGAVALAIGWFVYKNRHKNN